MNYWNWLICAIGLTIIVANIKILLESYKSDLELGDVCWFLNFGFLALAIIIIGVSI